MKFPNVFLVFLCVLLSPVLLRATHNQGGEIQYRKIGPLTVEATIITYTRASSVNADRDSLTLCWGDGMCERVARVNGPNGNGEIIAANIKRNLYTSVHTYTTPDRYWLSMTDPNRNAGILNVNFPSSENIPFHVQSMVNLLPEAALSTASPVFLEYPIDQALIDRPFFHVPNAYSPKGDSLVYELITPLMDFNQPVLNYLFPTAFMPGSDNMLTLDPETGLLSWISPKIPGAYVVALQIKSYREGVLVGVVIRDMSIEVLDDGGFNHPPTVELSTSGPAVFPVFLGDTVQLVVTVSDPDADQLLQLSSSSGLYSYFLDTATFTLAGANTGVFEWVVGNEYFRESPYQVVFKVKDNGSGFTAPSTGDNSALADLTAFGIIRYRVLASTSTNDPLKSVNSLRVFPNPARHQLSAQLPAPATDQFHYQITDFQGKVVQEARVPAGSTTIELQLHGFSPALYLLQVYDGPLLFGRAQVLVL